MRVLLVRPAPPRYTIGLKDLMVCEPLELEYVAAGLDGHEVEIVDLILEKDLGGRIRAFRPDIVATSSYITGVEKVKEVCRAAKAIEPRIRTVVGGVQATLVPGDFNDPAIDIVVRGDGVRTLPLVAERLSRGGGCEDVPGLAFPGPDGLRFSPAAPLSVDAASLPLPRRDLVERYRRRYYYLFHQPVTIMKTTFGCPFRCRFCYCWPLNEGQVSRRTPESIVEDLERIATRDVYIVDDTFFLDPGHLRSLRELILERRISKDYLVYGHADFIVRHPEVIRDWAAIGLKACILGLESPFDPELEDYHKKASVEANTEAIRILRRNGVDVYGSFIVDPRWTEKEFARLEAYIEDNGLYYVVIQPLTPLPGTEIFRDYEEHLIIPRRQHELWDMQHSVLATTLPLAEFYRKIHRIYLRQCANPWRARALQLRTAPPIWSKRYIRLLLGGLRVLKALRGAHRHSRRLERGGP